MVIEHKGKKITLDETESQILLWWTAGVEEDMDDGSFVDDLVYKARSLINKLESLEKGKIVYNDETRGLVNTDNERLIEKEK
jgi:hypothetical protein